MIDWPRTSFFQDKNKIILLNVKLRHKQAQNCVTTIVSNKA